VEATGFFVLSGLLFVIAILGLVIRRNAVALFFSLEILLNSANVLLVGFSKVKGNVYGQIFVFFVLAVAAAEAAVGLAILVSLYRHKKNVSTEEFTSLRW